LATLPSTTNYAGQGQANGMPYQPRQMSPVIPNEPAFRFSLSVFFSYPRQRTVHRVAIDAARVTD
jgi:hypothetical protein